MDTAPISFPGAVGGLLLLLTAASGGPPPASSAAREKEAPATWKLSELNELLPNPADRGAVSVLVWEVVEFDGVFTAEERCLVLKRYEKPTAKGPVCALGALTRQPKTQNPTWKSMAHHVLVPKPGSDEQIEQEIVAVEEYKALPTDDDLKVFLTKHVWYDALAPHELVLRMSGPARESVVRYVPKLSDGGISKGAWKKHFERDPPAHLFPELVTRSAQKGP